MEKKLVYIFLIINFFSVVSAQNVGIGTTNPQTIFHVDGSKDNMGTPNSTQLYNDVLVRQDGKVGIGNLPENNAKINISTNSENISENGRGFRLKDGTEGNGNLLSLSNTNGDVVWMPRVGTINGILQNSKINVNSNLVSTGTRIILPPGKWLIRSTILLRVEDPANNNFAIDGSLTDGVFARLSWADQNGTAYVPTADALSGNVFGGSYYSVYGLAFGQTVINNTTTAPKTYYLVTRTPTFWGTTMMTKVWRNLGGQWGENAIIAFPAN